MDVHFQCFIRPSDTNMEFNNLFYQLDLFYHLNYQFELICLMDIDLTHLDFHSNSFDDNLLVEMHNIQFNIQLNY